MTALRHQLKEKVMKKQPATNGFDDPMSVFESAPQAAGGYRCTWTKILHEGDRIDLKVAVTVTVPETYVRYLEELTADTQRKIAAGELKSVAPSSMWTNDDEIALVVLDLFHKQVSRDRTPPLRH
jgi:hypothetical protein